MNVVFIIPTGIGCAIGGHAGDATPAAKLIAQMCDKLILHPNVVNASDINEMPDNALYVEGSMLDAFISGEWNLQEVRSNRVLLVSNAPLLAETVNAVNAARTTIGGQFDILQLNTPLTMRGWVRDGVAGGEYSGVDELIEQVAACKGYDAVAIATPIDVDEGVAREYFESEGNNVNPWGAIEAEVSRRVAKALNAPVAHAPVESENTKLEEELFHILYNQIVDPRKAAEVCSNCYVHCILKGLHKAPRMTMSSKGIGFESISALVTPVGCIGAPHRACLQLGIPVIAVEENTTAYGLRCDNFIYVQNYLEAAGVIGCLNAGVYPARVRST